MGTLMKSIIIIFIIIIRRKKEKYALYNSITNVTTGTNFIMTGTYTFARFEWFDRYNWQIFEGTYDRTLLPDSIDS